MEAKRVVGLGLVLALVLGAGLLLSRGGTAQQCRDSAHDAGSRYQAQRIQFGAVTEFCLASPSRWANGVAVAPDGSVWFGEQALPGVGHLMRNGTVVEYPWPLTSIEHVRLNGTLTGIWGVAYWNGIVWGTDSDNGLIVGVEPGDGSVISVNTSVSAPFPYTLAVSPEGSLWFTSLSSHHRVGRIDSALNLAVYSVSGMGGDEPLQMDFVNSSYAYLVALDPFSLNGSGHLYAFDPHADSSTLTAGRVGAGFRLISPDSVSASQSGVWVVQHYPANIAGYSPESGVWTLYPTSTVPYATTTLPYFVESVGTRVWFNEHYANRVGQLDPISGTLTEYSEANPPVASLSDVQNDLTIAASAEGLWFTSTTGNYIGFVDGNYVPPFSVSMLGSDVLTMPPGTTRTASLEVQGAWQGALVVGVSDSENYTSIPSLFTIVPDKTTIPPGSGPVTLSVNLTAGSTIQPGRYTLAVTVTGGLLSQTKYIFVTVSQD